ncbi:MAG: aspartate kinase [Deltaproteobacteria bacterium]|nr:aspartate kinase [Deltaproteobacteria bacterium]
MKHDVVVQKYGGSSVADIERLRKVAALIKQRTRQGQRICVVVSAMGKTTDDLLERAYEVSKCPPRRELDMLLSAGERVSMSLLAMALEERGVESISFTGSQAGILTSDQHSDARILEVRPYRVTDELLKNKVVIVGGFQGVSYKREITTLGRGGSDTTAVALAAALDAVACEIYSDVEGVFSADPRVVDDAVKLSALSYEEMQELAAAGAQVLNAQAVQFAKEKGIALYCRKTGSPDEGTVIRRDAPSRKGRVRGIAHKERMYVVTTPFENASKLLAGLDEHHLAPAQVMGTAEHDLQVLLSPDDAHGVDAFFAALPDGATRQEDLGAVSLVGDGLLRERQAVNAGFRALRDAKIVLKGFSSSSFRATFLCAPKDILDATRVLHRECLLGVDT